MTKGFEVRFRQVCVVGSSVLLLTSYASLAEHSDEKKPGEALRLAEENDGTIPRQVELLATSMFACRSRRIRVDSCPFVVLLNHLNHE